ncbi:MAG: hypothetical protein HWN67_01135 [Candidatus Helarchaeota archaeon]|nr:hypothetical protein [Candidatus Helarchaeota archaeon]
MISITINIDIMGLFDEEKVRKIKIPNVEFFSINKLAKSEEIQDILLIFLPQKEDKYEIRERGWDQEEVEYVNEYLKNGGKAIIIFPLDQKDLEKFTPFYQIFEFSSKYNNTKQLLHVNPNLLIFNEEKEGKLIEGKRLVESYVHFLIDKKGEKIMEGNNQPVFMFLPVERGSLLLYGLGEETFWEENLEIILRYLNEDFDYFFQRIEYNIEFIKNVLKYHPRPEFLKEKFIQSLVKNKSIDEILNFEDEEFQVDTLNLLEFENFESNFKNLTGKKLEKEYTKLRDVFKKLKLSNTVEKLELFYNKKISEKRIINIDIIGLLNTEKVKQIKIPNIEFYLINELVVGEEIQDILLIFLPQKGNKNKIRKEGWYEDEAEYVKEYLKNGGKAIIIFPLNQDYLEKFLGFYRVFEFSAVYNNTKKLLHINPNLLFFNKNKEGKLIEAKRLVESYVHFLINKKGEIIMEGNYLPVFMMLPVEKGSLLLYGLGEESFWKEDLKLIFQYLDNDYEQFFQKIQYNVEFFKLISKNHPRPEILKEEFISSLIKNKSLNEILNFKDKEFQVNALKLLEFDAFESNFQNLTGKKLENEYIKLMAVLKKLNLYEVIKKLELFFIKKISEKRISYDHLIEIFEQGLLPPEAADLVVFFADPVSPQDFRNYRESIKKLMKWNKSLKIFNEDELKNLLWEKLQQEDEKTKRWRELQEKRRLKEEEEKRKREEERELRLKQLEKEALEKKRLDEEKKKEEEQEKLNIIELQKKLRDERQKLYEERHKKRLDKEKSKEDSLIEARTRRLKAVRERERLRRVRLIKRRKALELEVKKLREEKLKLEQETKQRDVEFQKILEERKIRVKKYREEEEKRRLEVKEKLEEKKRLRLKKLEKIKPTVKIAKKPEIVGPLPIPEAPLPEELNDFIDLMFNPYDYISELVEYNKLLKEEETAVERTEELLLEFIELIINPADYLETLSELSEFDDLEEELD